MDEMGCRSHIQQTWSGPLDAFNLVADNARKLGGQKRGGGGAIIICAGVRLRNTMGRTEAVAATAVHVSEPELLRAGGAAITGFWFRFSKTHYGDSGCSGCSRCGSSHIG